MLVAHRRRAEISKVANGRGAPSLPSGAPVHPTWKDVGGLRMTGFDCVLIPLDGSDRAEAALDWVRVLNARRSILKVKLDKPLAEFKTLTEEARTQQAETRA